jgi:O-antigen/teichoic acid export membrane protein
MVDMRWKLIKPGLIRDSASVSLLAILSSILGLAISLFLARFLGVYEYGLYSYALAITSFLVIPTTLGFDKLLLRNVAIYRIHHQWGLMRGLLKTAYRIALFIPLSLIIIVILIRISVSSKPLSEMTIMFWLALLLLPLFELIILQKSAMRGLQKIVLSQVPDLLIRPILMLIFVFAAYSIARKEFSAYWAIALLATSLVFSLVLSSFILKNSLPQEIRKIPSQTQLRPWLKSTISLFLFICFLAVVEQADKILLGILKGPAEIGIYSVVKKLSSLIIFALNTSNIALAPTVASLFAAQKKQQLQLEITRSARLVGIASVAIAAVIILFSKQILLFYGNDFVEGARALRILGIAHVLGALSGFAATILIMTGFEKISALGAGVSAIINVLLNIVFIHLWGITGAALATAASMLLLNLFLVWMVRKKLGIQATLIG